MGELSNSEFIAAPVAGSEVNPFGWLLTLGKDDLLYWLHVAVIDESPDPFVVTVQEPTYGFGLAKQLQSAPELLVARLAVVLPTIVSEWRPDTANSGNSLKTLLLLLRVLGVTRAEPAVCALLRQRLGRHPQREMLTTECLQVLSGLPAVSTRSEYLFKEYLLSSNRTHASVALRGLARHLPERALRSLVSYCEGIPAHGTPRVLDYQVVRLMFKDDLRQDVSIERLLRIVGKLRDKRRVRLILLTLKYSVGLRIPLRSPSGSGPTYLAWSSEFSVNREVDPRLMIALEDLSETAQSVMERHFKIHTFNADMDAALRLKASDV